MATEKQNRRIREFNSAKLLRMDILSGLYKRGYSYREMRSEVMARLNLRTYSLRTVKEDIDSLLAEWRETRIEDLDLALQLELERIDNLVKEAWEAWDRSKESYKKVKGTQEGIPGTPDGEGDGQAGEIITTKMKQTSEDVVSYGDPRYLEVINRLLMERRKLLGLYSPEKMDVSGDMSFYAMLMHTGKE